VVAGEGVGIEKVLKGAFGEKGIDWNHKIRTEDEYIKVVGRSEPLFVTKGSQYSYVEFSNLWDTESWEFIRNIHRVVTSRSCDGSMGERVITKTELLQLKELREVVEFR
jgi:hypothetical protein